MKNIRLSGLLLALLFWIGSPILAQEGGAAAAEAPKAFFQAVNAQDFGTAWGLMTEASKNRISTLLSEETKLSVPEQRALFDNNDPKVQTQFWNDFRESSKANLYVGFTYTYGGPGEDGLEVVKVSAPQATEGQTIDLFVKNEGGYKFGLVETFKI